MQYLKFIVAWANRNIQVLKGVIINDCDIVICSI